MTQPIPTSAHEAVLKIRQHFPDFRPQVGIILGSGLGGFADHLENKQYLPYDQIPGFPVLTVHGHAGNLILGELHGIKMACLQGRVHRYEGDNYHIVKNYVRTLRLLGCDYFIATNASGSLQETMPPGELMLVTDHINLQPANPLIGPNDDEFGPRFFPLDNAYDKDMRKTFAAIAEKEGITLHQGTYLSVIGPNYETAAEIRAFRLLGADAVGMSTVPEVLVANHCGMKVAVIATITNYATGLDNVSHCHHAVVNMAEKSAEQLSRLVKHFISTLV